MLLFIPNEQLYAFIQEQDGAILDEALRRKLVFCSPLTLFAVLAVVRQAVDNFRVERTSRRSSPGSVRSRSSGGCSSRRWTSSTDRSRPRASDFDELTGTRRRMLERELDKIDDLRRANGARRA